MSVVASNFTLVNKCNPKPGFQNLEPPPRWTLVYELFSIVMEIDTRLNAFSSQYQFCGT